MVATVVNFHLSTFYFLLLEDCFSCFPTASKIDYKITYYTTKIEKKTSKKMKQFRSFSGSECLQHSSVNFNACSR